MGYTPPAKHGRGIQLRHYPTRRIHVGFGLRLVPIADRPNLMHFTPICTSRTAGRDARVGVREREWHVSTPSDRGVLTRPHVPPLRACGHSHNNTQSIRDLGYTRLFPASIPSLQSPAYISRPAWPATIHVRNRLCLHNQLVSAKLWRQLFSQGFLKTTFSAIFMATNLSSSSLTTKLFSNLFWRQNFSQISFGDKSFIKFFDDKTFLKSLLATKLSSSSFGAKTFIDSD